MGVGSFSRREISYTNNTILANFMPCFAWYGARCRKGKSAIPTFSLSQMSKASLLVLCHGEKTAVFIPTFYRSATIWKTLRNRAVSCIIRHGIIKKYRVLRHKKRERQDEQHRKCRINPTPSLNPTPYPSPEITNKQRDFQGLV